MADLHRTRSAICAQCEIGFEYVALGRKRLYCTGCRKPTYKPKRWPRKPRNRSRVRSGFCVACQAPFETGANAQRFCIDPECIRKRQNAKDRLRYEKRRKPRKQRSKGFVKGCAYCGVEFVASYSGRKVCSLACSGKLTAIRKRTVPEATCRNCGKTFQPRQSENRTFCSRQCSFAFKAADHPYDYGDGDRTSNRKRARKYNVPYFVVKREDVIRLHGRVCWICKKKIGELPHPHPQSLSLDHIVPLSLGGWHHISNLKPAHLSCNSTKGDRYTGQLMLKLTPAR